MKTRWYYMKKNMKNWRWWFALPYMIPFAVFWIAILLIAVFFQIIGDLGDKIEEKINDREFNPLFAKQVVDFIERGFKK